MLSRFHVWGCLSRNRLFAWLLLAWGAACLVPATAVPMDGPGDATTPMVAPAKIVTYKQLLEFLKENKGKVIVLDFWTDACVECKLEFPHLVNMHRKYKNQGLVGVGVNLDEPGEKETMKKVNEFLTKVKADMPNFVLNEKQADWEKFLGITATPAVFVVGRDGKLAKRFLPEVSPDNPEGKVDYQRIRPFVEGLLERKD